MPNKQLAESCTTREAFTPRPRPRRLHLTACIIATLATVSTGNAQTIPDASPSRVVFGSCFRETRRAPIWRAVDSSAPDLFIMLGDNIYGDTEDMSVLRAKYAKLGAVPQFAKLRETIPCLAVWDDHDYGENDGGKHYPMREASQEVFLDFWGEPDNTDRRRTPGIYDAEAFGDEDQRVQVILLDTRYFRTDLARSTEEGFAGDGRNGPYAPTDDPNQQMLGEAQWSWLEARLREPAQIRLVASSIQVIPEDHGWEKWANMPRERTKLFKMIRDTGANGVIFLSGDRHLAELSRWDPARAEPRSGGGVDPGYPVWEVTASSFNQGRDWRNEVNRHGVGNQYHGANFGVIEIDWDQTDPTISLQIRDARGRTVIREDTTVGSLRPD